MKDKVIKFLKNLPNNPYDRFNEAYELYRRSEGKNVHVERMLNSAGFSESRLENLLYDLKKIHDISDMELATAMVSKEENDEVVFEKELLEEEKELLEEENEELKMTIEELEEQNERLKVLGLNRITPQSVRVEFEFLGHKDCPNELKILVADKITAWNNYLNAHDQLQQLANGTLTVSKEEEVALTKEAVECYEENQRIYDELNAYKATGKVLGAHPIFKKLKVSREVDEMNMDALLNFRNSTAKYFTDNKKKLAKAEETNDEKRIKEVKARVLEREMKLDFVNKKLGIPSK